MGKRIARGMIIGVLIGTLGGVILSYLINFISSINEKATGYETSGVSLVKSNNEGIKGNTDESGNNITNESNKQDEVIEAFGEYGEAAPYCNDLEDVILRFHVKANSNSENDIDLKYKVRDAILMQLGSKLEGNKSKEEVMLFLSDNLDYIKDIANKTISEEGYDYDVKVYISKDYFPIRQYGELILPAGEYEALRVDIGEAKGENFWCILYPMMCYPLEAGAVVSKEDGEKLEEVLGEEDYKKLFVEHDKKDKESVKVKFKILELFGL